MKDLVIIAVYRQPNSANLEKFFDCIECVLKTVDKAKNEIVIAGDMNLDLLSYETTSRYLDLMSNQQILPRIVRPTRIKKQSATLIVHIFTRNNQNTLTSGIIDVELAGNCGYTDHKPVFTILRSRLTKREQRPETVTSYFTQKATNNANKDCYCITGTLS